MKKVILIVGCFFCGCVVVMAQSSEQKNSTVSVDKVSTVKSVENNSNNTLVKGVPAPGPNDINPVRQDRRKAETPVEVRTKQTNASSEVTEQKQPK